MNDENKKWVSIIIPIYNAEKTVKRCIESVLRQDYPYMEVILIDDGSTDHSGQICDAYKEIERVVVIHQENDGLVRARCVGIERSKGQYIGFVDADDYIEQNMISELMRELGEGDFIHSGYFGGDAEYSAFPNNYIEFTSKLRVAYIRCVLGMDIDFSISPSIWSKIFKKSLIEKVYVKVPEKQMYGEDLLCLIRALLEADSMRLLPKAFYHYEYQENSMSRSSEGAIEKEIGLFNCIHDIFKDYKMYDFSKEEKFFLESHLLTAFRKNKNPFLIEQYHYGGIDAISKETIYIYGAGDVGKSYYSHLCRESDCQVAGIIDKNYKQYSELGNIVKAPETLLKDHSYDHIIIAVLKERFAEQIKNELISKGVREEKIIWSKPINFIQEYR